MKKKYDTFVRSYVEEQEPTFEIKTSLVFQTWLQYRFPEVHIKFLLLLFLRGVANKLLTHRP